MKIPYGISNFTQVRAEGYFYVDKTPFLPVLEDLGPRYLLFLRPRRMGKSLFVSLLEHYYDLGRADAFDALFRGLWIHDHPTPGKNRYLVLTLDFSQVSVDGGEEALHRSFFGTVQAGVRTLLLRYQDRIAALGDLLAAIDRHDDAAALTSVLLSIVAATGHALYVLIDEYDNFANRLLSGGAPEVYEALVTRTGFVRTFYATLKAGTASGAVGRMFITGVAPLLLDDISSGFNIATHLSQSPRFNTLAGFTHAEVELGLGPLLAERPEIVTRPGIGDRARLLEVLEQYYDGYRFSADASERVFNSDMVLYFLRELQDVGGFPADMLDLNVRTDYRRLQHIGMLAGSGRAERRALLETITGEGGIQSPIERQLGLRSLSSQTQFISLLYYLGLLTLGTPPEGAPVFGYQLTIPNRVIRELTWEHLVMLLQDEAHVDVDTRDLGAALAAMAVQGDIAVPGGVAALSRGEVRLAPGAPVPALGREGSADRAGFRAGGGAGGALRGRRAAGAAPDAGARAQSGGAGLRGRAEGAVPALAGGGGGSDACEAAAPGAGEAGAARIKGVARHCAHLLTARPRPPRGAQGTCGGGAMTARSRPPGYW